MISVVCIINFKGDILVLERCRDDISQDEIKRTVRYITKGPVESFTPWIKSNNIHGHYLRRDRIILLALSKREISSIVILHFLERFYNVLSDFCGQLTESTIESNMVLLHELISECVQNGYIQTTNTDQLRTVVYSDPIIPKDSQKPGPFGLEKTVTPGTSAEKPLVKFRTGKQGEPPEVFIDIVENLIVHFRKDGSIHDFHLSGKMIARSFLSNNHIITVRLEDPIHVKRDKDAYSTEGAIDRLWFSDDVNNKSFEKDKSFSFNPIQGKMQLTTYYMDNNIPANLPFRLATSIHESTTNHDCNLTVKLECHIPGNTSALNLIIHIPVPSSTQNVMQQISIPNTSAKFSSKDREILWKIEKLPGNSEVIAKFKLVDALQSPVSRLSFGPVALEFEISNFVCSKMAVRSLKVEGPSKISVPVKKWVRYVTLTDSYLFNL